MLRRFEVVLLFLLMVVLSFLASSRILFAQTTAPVPARLSSLPSPSPEESPTPTPKPDLTQKTEETIGPLEKLLKEQKLGLVWANPVKYAIRGAIEAGVPANTIVLLLLLPIVAAVIAAARHLVGLRGFGIFLPAALSVVFISTGPVVGLGLFLVIVIITFIIRLTLKKIRVRLQYLPRMAFLLWAVSLGILTVLFAAPLIKKPEITNVSIFPILFLTLLAEDFTRVQIGKSIRTAVSLTTETLVLALISYMFLTFDPLQKFALLNPEIILFSVAAFDFIVGRYVGLRFLELWRFRKLISG